MHAQPSDQIADVRNQIGSLYSQISSLSSPAQDAVNSASNNASVAGTDDALGSVAALSNHQGKLKTRYQYGAYGEVLAGDMSDVVGIS
jgi:hypothetical protein